MSRTHIRITHRPTGTVLAAGPLGWGITPFEGNYYVRRRHVRTDRLRSSLVPGFCIYKFLYVWLDLSLDQGQNVPGIRCRAVAEAAPDRPKRTDFDDPIGI